MADGRAPAKTTKNALAMCPPPARGGKVPDVSGYAGTFKALADETRLRVLMLIAGANEPLCACEIEERFALSQSTISHHMKILREAGLVTGEKRGSWTYYALAPKGFKGLEKVLALAP